MYILYRGVYVYTWNSLSLYIYIYTCSLYIERDIHIHVYTYIYIYIHICVGKCIYIYICDTLDHFGSWVLGFRCRQVPKTISTLSQNHLIPN